jgi:protein SCO1/2
MSDQLHGLQRTFPDEELSFVSFSVDPETDRPETLLAYAERYGSDPRWRLLTGDRQAIFRLSRDGFHLAVGEDPASATEPIVHSVRLILVDRTGRIVGYYSATDAAQMAQLRKDVRGLLEQPG